MQKFEFQKGALTKHVKRKHPETLCEKNENVRTAAQSAFTCSKLTIETLEQGVEYVQS